MTPNDHSNFEVLLTFDFTIEMYHCLKIVPNEKKINKKYHEAMQVPVFLHELR